jgi:hypothetical protein
MSGRTAIRNTVGVVLILLTVPVALPILGISEPPGPIGTVSWFAIAIAPVPLVAGLWLISGMPIIPLAAWGLPLAVAGLVVHTATPADTLMRAAGSAAIVFSALSFLLFPRLAFWWCAAVQRVVAVIQKR